MKSFLRLLIAGALLAPAALLAASFEGRVSYKLTSPREKAMEMHQAIKGEKMRIEKPGAKEGGSMILDTKKKEMIMLMDSEKMYMTMQIPDDGDVSGGRADEVKIEKTNVTEKILGYTATKYIATHDTTKSEMWLAEGIGTFMGMGNNSGGGGGGGLFGGRKKTDGGAKSWEKALAGKDLFPLRVVELDKAGKERFRMEVTAIKKESLPDSLFTPPADYQKFDMGGMMKGLIPGLGR
ncbi:MAG: DUF4412 domain-containing protein [Opitutaceae bacterium]|nr:DUF4412 domain-containing protein [Opitutaceae bacterium]